VVFLLDTNAFSDLMRRDARVEARLDALSSDTDVVVLCAIVTGEVCFGLDRMPEGKRRRELEERSRELFSLFPCEPVTEAAGRLYASIKLKQQRKGWSLDENDLWVAATALALGATLVTRDSDLQAVDGLAVADWTKAAP
jgi:predicted nucleic acid-binding protein